MTIGCVSATDDIQTDGTVAIDDNTIEEEPLTDNNAPGTFSELFDEISASQSGDGIELTRDYTYNPDTDSEHSDGINIYNPHNFTIDGKGHTLSGNDQARIMIYFAPSSSYDSTCVIIKNTIFTKSKTNDGVALKVLGQATLINCTFIDNEYFGVDLDRNSKIINCTFLDHSGVAVKMGWAGTVENSIFNNACLEMDNGFVKNCTFENYYGTRTSLNTGYGTVENCRFINNTARLGGVAIYQPSDAHFPLYVTNCAFINNTAERGITVLYRWMISNSTFENNDVNIDGGRLNNGEATIENSKFINSKITNQLGDLTLSKNSFVNGYIDNNGTIKSSVHFIVLEHVQQAGTPLILLRVVDGDGNSIYDERIREDLISLTINNEEITLNQFIEIDGNWYYATSKDLPEGKYDVNISLKSPNKFNELYLQNTISNGTLEIGDFNNFANLDNKIKTQGNIITLTEDYTFDITGGFDRNGILIDRNNIIIDGNGHTINAASVARIFNITGQNVTLRNINFKNGFSDKGGAIYSLSDVTIDHCTFNNNHALNGGALYLENAKIIDSTFSQNIAEEYGGAAYLINANITNSTFTQNTAYKAGALYLLGSVNIDQSTFTSNYAEKGLAILNGALLNIENTKFEDQTDGNCNNEIILILNGDVTLNNVTPNELNPIHTVELDFNFYGQSGMLFIYSADLVFEITALNEGTILDHGVIRARIDSSNYTFEIVNGLAIIKLPILEVGMHTVNFTYDEGDKYEKASLYFDFEITPASSYLVPNTYYVPEGEIYTVSLFTIADAKLVGEEIVFSIGNTVIKSITNNDGVASLTLTPSLVKTIGYGEKYIKISFKGNENVFESSITAPIKITPADFIPPKHGDFVDSNGDLSVFITDNNGRPLRATEVNLILGDSIIGNAVSDGNGIATFHMPEEILAQLQSGPIQVAIRYFCNGQYRIINKNIKLMSDSQILASSASYVINYGGTYSVTLKDVNSNPLSGKQVTFILNGKTIGSAVTNANGVASLKLTATMLKATKVGSKNLVIKFNGDSNYISTSKTVKITIKKEKTKIVAKKKTFKRATKTKKYTITLKNSKGKAVKKAKVTIKVGKKTYKAKTNTKGKATFKITKLTKKGKYTAKITYKTTAYYLKATKKVKITIK